MEANSSNGENSAAAGEVWAIQGAAASSPAQV